MNGFISPKWTLAEGGSFCDLIMCLCFKLFLGCYQFLGKEVLAPTRKSKVVSMPNPFHKCRDSLFCENYINPRDQFCPIVQRLKIIYFPGFSSIITILIILTLFCCLCISPENFGTLMISLVLTLIYIYSQSSLDSARGSFEQIYYRRSVTRI